MTSFCVWDILVRAVEGRTSTEYDGSSSFLSQVMRMARIASWHMDGKRKDRRNPYGQEKSKRRATTEHSMA